LFYEGNKVFFSFMLEFEVRIATRISTELTMLALLNHLSMALSTAQREQVFTLKNQKFKKYYGFKFFLRFSG